MEGIKFSVRIDSLSFGMYLNTFTWQQITA